MHKRSHSWPVLTAALIAVSGCGSGDGGSPAGSESAAPAAANSAATAATAAEVPDACTFFAKTELETAVGAELKDGEPQSVPDASESSCEFERQLGRNTTKTFSDPPIPSSVGLTSVKVSTSPTEPKTFSEGRELTGGEGVKAVGDDAFFIGPNLLHVRVGNRSFSLRINPEAGSPQDQAKVREVMLGLARTGASRL